MLLTDPGQIQALMKDNFRWLGIPAIERTRRGRLFVSWYTGADTVDFGNYAPLIFSDDGGAHWSPVVAAAWFGPDARAYDECLWIDPLGRLWFIYSRQPDHAVWASVCDDPDAEVLKWRDPACIGRDVMLNKPIVASDGRWLFPIAVWREGLTAAQSALASPTPPPRLAFVYESRDQGRTFTRLGGADVPGRWYDEHMIYEKRDGSLRMLVRTQYGIGESLSKDGGLTWSEGRDTGWGGPNSRFHIRRLLSGNLLLINHANFTGRNNLTAFLSEDDGETWKGGLLLDSRPDVSYPDAAQSEDGGIWAVYDRERTKARELLLARFTEEDILRGAGGSLRNVIVRAADPRE